MPPSYQSTCSRLMLISIAAFSRNRVIGRQGKIPWHLPADMRYFRENTRGGIVLMGCTTFESIGHPLSHRDNWVLTRSHRQFPDDIRIFHSMEDVLKAVPAQNTVWIIGGQKIYQQFLPHCRKQFLTCIEADIEGDAYYPEFSEQDWHLTSSTPGPPGEAYPYQFNIYERL